MKSTRLLNGYRVIYLPNHPSAMKSKNWEGYVYEHIVVAEDCLGRPLTKKEVVHHLNGKRDDNRSENILVLERSMHARLHMWLDNGATYEGTIREIALNTRKNSSQNPRICLTCGKTIQCSTNKDHCSHECASFSKRKVDWPTREQLELDLKTNTWVSLGKKYGVSDNAVRKWAKAYDLTKSSS